MSEQLLSPDNMPNYLLLDSPEYFELLSDDIEQTTAGDRVIVVSMGFDPSEEATQKLIHDYMIPAARRFVDVSLVVDGYSFMFDEKFLPTGPLVPGMGLRTPKPYFQRKEDELKMLEKEGITVGISHVPTKRLHLPHAGRSHIKGAVVNDAFYIGGTSLDNTATPDAMVRIQDKLSSDHLYEIYKGLSQGLTMRDILNEVDTVFKVDENTHIYHDAGKRNQSLILDKAMEVIDNAEEWIMMSCQFFPGGRTAKRIAKAFNERGVIPYVVYNNPKEKRLGGNIMRALSLYERRHLPTEVFEYMLPSESAFIHAKILASEKEGMISSHNFINHGSILGTAEVAFHKREAKFGQELGSLIMRLVNWEQAFPDSDFSNRVLDYAG